MHSEVVRDKHMCQYALVEKQWWRWNDIKKNFCTLLWVKNEVINAACPYDIEILLKGHVRLLTVEHVN